jgi:hypothetical protein
MKRAAREGGPFSCRLTWSALLRVLAALIGALFAAGLAVLAVLLLLLAVAIRLRFFLILLVGGVSHFPSPFAALNLALRRPINPLEMLDVP